MEETHILVVDDNPEIREIIHILLQGEGFITTEAADGIQALAALRERDFDLIILDIMMPQLNGYQTCLEIRKTCNAPILFLSARTKESDKTLGFSSGGDDYLAKPFSYNELVSRAKALIRRYQIYQGKQASSNADAPGISFSPAMHNEKNTPAVHTQASPLTYHHLTIDEQRETVMSGETLLELTDTEYALLLLFLKNRKQVFSAERIYETIWQEPYYYGANNTVMVHIRNLRKKIEPDPAHPILIKTIWGRGYRCD
ncbi:MAG TPA: DNA-binding response regulator [Lachnospiraceae bacterium]|nr:DNA-binding response regulator [Lachnospiraceae bacterium]